MIRLLIAEDEKMIREGLVSTVPWTRMGFEVVGSTNNGVGALEMAKRLDPQLILMDIRMPKMDGLELLEIVHREMPRIKVVILSGYDDFSYAQKALRLGALDYLLKPVDLALITETMERVRDQIGLPLGEIPSEPDSDQQHRLLLQISEYLHAHFQEDLRIEDLAKRVGLSPSYFSHLFNKTHGLGLREYLNKLRISEACRLLSTSPLKVYEIATLVGFTDYKYFSLVFHKVTGSTPTRYRPPESHLQSPIFNHPTTIEKGRNL